MPGDGQRGFLVDKPKTRRCARYFCNVVMAEVRTRKAATPYRRASMRLVIGGRWYARCKEVGSPREERLSPPRPLRADFFWLGGRIAGAQDSPRLASRARGLMARR